MLAGGLLTAALLAQPAPLPFPVHVHGNLVMPEEVYRAVLTLPPQAQADLESATSVREQLRSFLLRAGYELAQVEVGVEKGALQVIVDEGQVEKIVFRGRFTFQTLRVRLALQLPYDVFNRPELDRQLRALEKELHLGPIRYELVPTRQVDHVGFQVDQLPEIQGLEFVHGWRAFELHISFTEHEWGTGTWLDLRSSYPDGIEGGPTSQGTGLLLPDDRWRLAGSAAGNLRQAILDSHFYVAPTRLFAEARWYSPQLGLGLGRPFVWLRAEGTGRQRSDLCIENYFHEQADASVNVQYQPLPKMTVGVGAGAQFRRVFDVQTVTAQTYCLANALPSPGPFPEKVKAFGLLQADLVLDEGADRWDRRHAMSVEARHSFGFSGLPYGQVHGQYQRVFSFGWHDLWVRARAAALWGQVTFHDEEPLGRHVRGVFGADYVHHVASASAEFRYSITRDIFKASVFNDAAVFGHLSRDLGVQEVPEVADSFGLGFHALVEGMFQLDIYLAFGAISGPRDVQGPPSADARFVAGGTLVLEKVF